jgi:hypothetical protein
MFIHVPKTGGTWVVDAIKAAGIESESKFNKHATWYEIWCNPRQDNFDPTSIPVFAFVRHPFEWLRSYWRFREGARIASGHGPVEKWQPHYAAHHINQQVDYCAHWEFEVFLERVLERCPGYVSRMFDAYVGSRDFEISFIGTQENLCEDLVRALRLHGEVFDEAALRATPHSNVSSGPDVTCSPRLYQRVCDAEKVAMERFEYAA